MNTNFILLLGFSIAIPAIIGLVRLPKISKTYYPFLALLWLGLINEVFSTFRIQEGKSNAVSANIFFLAQSLLILFQFYNWKVFQQAKKMYTGLTMLLILTWLAEIFLFRSIAVFASYFIIFHSYLVSLLSIHMIGLLLEKERTPLSRNPIFLICVCYLVYFTYAVLVESFYLYGISASLHFQKAMMRIMTFINLLTNLLFAIAITWMPKKQRFSHLY